VKLRLAALLALVVLGAACRRRNPFKVHERFESQLLTVPIIEGLYPFSENKELFKRMFSRHPDGEKTYELMALEQPSRAEEIYLSNGATKMAQYTVRQTKVSCADAYALVRKAVEHSKAQHETAEAELLPVGMATWLTAWDGHKTLEYYHCRDGLLWRLAYVDFSAESRTDLLRFSRRNVEQATLVFP